jgi:steroid delta-isomerase-like uncharacterized protein
MSTVMTTPKLDTFRELLAAFTRKDWEAYKAHLAPDAVYEETATHLRFSGPEEIVEGLRAWTTAFPDVRATVMSTTESPNEIMAEVAWEGTHSGPLAVPMGTIPPTGKVGNLRAVLVNVFAGDRVREIRHYFDLMDLLGQLGVTPGAAVAEAEVEAAAVQGAAPS